MARKGASSVSYRERLAALVVPVVLVDDHERVHLRANYLMLSCKQSSRWHCARSWWLGFVGSRSSSCR
jgi:hypothetical protein